MDSEDQTTLTLTKSNSSNIDLDHLIAQSSSTVGIVQFQYPEEPLTTIPDASTPMENLVQDSPGSLVLASNQAQTIGSSSFGNPDSLLVLDNPNSLLQLSNSSPLIPNETLPDHHLSPLVSLIPGGRASQIQEQDLTAIRCYSPFHQPLNEILPMLPDLGISDENNSNNQLLVPNTIGNNTVNGINHHHSMYPQCFQKNPVDARARIGTGISNGPIMTSQRSTLSLSRNDHITSFHRAGNSRNTQIYNHQNNNYHSQAIVPNTSGHYTSSVYLPSESSSNAILNILNRNAISTVSSSGPSTFISPQQNQRLNSLNGRDFIQELARQPYMEARAFRVSEGQLLPSEAHPIKQIKIGEYSPSGVHPLKHMDIGQCSSSKHQKDSSTFEKDETQPKIREAEQIPENENLNNNIINPSFVSFPRNSLYDPFYESMGLPIDPHIRLLNKFLDANADPERNGYHLLP